MSLQAGPHPPTFLGRLGPVRNQEGAIHVRAQRNIPSARQVKSAVAFLKQNPRGG